MPHLKKLRCWAQVGVVRVQSCPPLSEEEIYPVLAPNYHGDGTNKFRLNLSHQQVGLRQRVGQGSCPGLNPILSCNL